MPGTPTAHHALNLFSLTMESRHGCDWQDRVDPTAIVALADEIVVGFGAEMATPHPVSDDAGRQPTLWRFPDGSHCRTGAFGLTMEDAATPPADLRRTA